MTTSRTGTAVWKNLRLRVLRREQSNGLANCPICGVQLDYEVGRKPNSAEVDHIVSYAVVQRDTIDNLRVICRRCNQSLGAKQAVNPKRATQTVQTIDFTL